MRKYTSLVIVLLVLITAVVAFGLYNHNSVEDKINDVEKSIALEQTGIQSDLATLDELLQDSLSTAAAEQERLSKQASLTAEFESLMAQLQALSDKMESGLKTYVKGDYADNTLYDKLMNIYSQGSKIIEKLGKIENQLTPLQVIELDKLRTNFQDMPLGYLFG